MFSVEKIVYLLYFNNMRNLNFLLWTVFDTFFIAVLCIQIGTAEW